MQARADLTIYSGFTNRVEVTGENGNPLVLARRIDSMSDEEIKTRVADLVAKL